MANAMHAGIHYTAGLVGAMGVKFLAQGNTTTGVASHSPINTAGSTGAMQLIQLGQLEQCN